MDALYRMLVTEYKMDPDKAKQYADMIHKDHSNPDNLQTEAYSKAAGTKQDYANATSTDGESANTDTVQGRMGQLAARARLFTDLHKRKLAGEQLDPENERYYSQVMALHQQKVREGANRRIGAQDTNAAMAGGMLQGAQANGPGQRQAPQTPPRSRADLAMSMYEPQPAQRPQQPGTGQVMANVGAYHAGEGARARNPQPDPTGGNPQDFQFPFEREQNANLYERFLQTYNPTLYQGATDLPMAGVQAPEPFRQAAQDAYTKGRR